MQKLASLVRLTTAIATLSLAGCSSSDSTSSTPSPQSDSGCPATGCPAEGGATPEGGTTDPPPVNAGDKDLPPTGSAADIKAWLALGEYKTGGWKCEAAPHEARSPSPHGTNRICSNATLSAHGAGEYPIGSAGVKELYAGTEIKGYAVYRKLKTGGGEAWYWFEELDGSIVVNDTGDKGAAKSICVGCHAGAGSDAMHSGHDQVYTQVK